MKASIVIGGAFCLLLTSLLAVGPAGSAAANAPSSGGGFKVIQPEPRLQYPMRMLFEGVQNGSVKARLHVDAEGRLTDFLLVAYTRKPFADEVEQKVRLWRFEPTRTATGPIATVVDFIINFEIDGVMVVQRYGLDRTTVEEMRDYRYQPCSVQDLDRRPTPITMAKPAYPLEWKEKGITGQAVVDFYIDEEGKVRMPTAEAAHDWLASVAIDAVEKWQFAPPTSKGKRVLVHAQQMFDFQKEQVAATN